MIYGPQISIVGHAAMLFTVDTFHKIIFCFEPLKLINRPVAFQVTISSGVSLPKRWNEQNVCLITRNLCHQRLPGFRSKRDKAQVILCVLIIYYYFYL